MPTFIPRSRRSAPTGSAASLDALSRALSACFLRYADGDATKAGSNRRRKLPPMTANGKKAVPRS